MGSFRNKEIRKARKVGADPAELRAAAELKRRTEIKEKLRKERMADQGPVKTGLRVADTSASMDRKKRKAAVKALEGKGDGEGSDEGSGGAGGGDEFDDDDVHKADLEKLKETDPEFYRFLQENDQGLLEFGAGDEDDDEEEGEDDDDEENDDDDEENDDDDDDDEDGAQGKKKKNKQAAKEVAPRGILTAELFAKIKAGVEAPTPTIEAVREAVRAFRSCCHFGESLGETEAGDFLVSSEAVFQNVLVFCTSKMGSVFDRYLGFVRGSKPTAAGRGIVLPNKNEGKWKKLQQTVKSYLKNLFRLMKDVTDPGMAAFLARYTAATMTPYLSRIPGASEKLLGILLM